eukprot:3461990-Pyramimonas_sp.AAC.1
MQCGGGDLHTSSRGTVWAHAKKHPACLQGALSFLGFDCFATESATFSHQKSMDALGSQGW